MTNLLFFFTGILTVTTEVHSSLFSIEPDQNMCGECFSKKYVFSVWFMLFFIQRFVI